MKGRYLFQGGLLFIGVLIACRVCAETLEFYQRSLPPSLNVRALFFQGRFRLRVTYQRVFRQTAPTRLTLQAAENGRFDAIRLQKGASVAKIEVLDPKPDALTLMLHPHATRIPPPQEMAQLGDQTARLAQIRERFMASVRDGQVTNAERNRFSHYGRDLKRFLLALSVVLRGEAKDLGALTLDDLRRVAAYYRRSPSPAAGDLRSYLRRLQQALLGVEIEFVFIPENVVNEDLNADPRYAERIPVNATVGKAVVRGMFTTGDLVDWWYLPHAQPRTVVKPVTGHSGPWFFFSASPLTGYYLRVVAAHPGPYTFTVIHPDGRPDHWVEVFERALRHPPKFPY